MVKIGNNSGSSGIFGAASTLVAILVVTAVAWFLLAVVASKARQEGATVTQEDTIGADQNGATKIPKGIVPKDYKQATEFAKSILGLAAILAGFLGFASAAKSGSGDGDGDRRAWNAAGGATGLVAGAVLLDIGGVVAPVALGVLAGGSASLGLRKFLES